MGTESIWIPLVAAAVSGGISYDQQTKQAKRQDNQLADNINKQAQTKAEANKKTAETVAEVQNSAPQSEANRLLSQYQQQLRGGNAAATAGLSANGATSDRQAADVASAALGIAANADDQAKIAAATDAPRYQRQAERKAIGRAGDDLNLISKTSQSNDFLGRLKLQGIQQDPLANAFASAVAAYGSSYSGGAGGGGGWGSQTALDTSAPINGVNPNLFRSVA